MHFGNRARTVAQWRSRTYTHTHTRCKTKTNICRIYTKKNWGKTIEYWISCRKLNVMWFCGVAHGGAYANVINHSFFPRCRHIANDIVCSTRWINDKRKIKWWYSVALTRFGRFDDWHILHFWWKNNDNVDFNLSCGCRLNTHKRLVRARHCLFLILAIGKQL